MSAQGVTLGELVSAGLAIEARGDASLRVNGVRHDSRDVRPGELFVAVPGLHADGTAFVADALARGASAIASEQALAIDAPVLRVSDAKSALGKIAHRVYGEPTASLVVVGITGTNGKTTTASLLEAAVSTAGGVPAVMGTTGWRAPGIHRTSVFTTPQGDDIARFAREALDASATHLVMEVSSHGLALDRVAGVRFRVAAFTNLTQDHLDFHGDLASYAAAKARLFTDHAPEASVIHVDDPFGAELAERAVGRVLRCTRRAGVPAEVRVVSSSIGRAGIRARIETPAGIVVIESPMLGEHNLENLLVAVGCAVALGLSPERMGEGLSHAVGAPGRLERVDDPRGTSILVDYAHTPDALEHALGALRPLTPGRLVVVFGCGGDRDRAKRPRMGEAAGRLADLCVLTSDNPRTEDPASILAAILPGVIASKQPEIDTADLARAARGYVVIPDRAEAIRRAVVAARPDDTVLIAGKGHEDYQIVGATRRPFDDRVEARRAIASIAGGGSA